MDQRPAALAKSEVLQAGTREEFVFRVHIFL
jgi:hypothetical protein